MESLFIEFLPRSKMGMITPICGNNYMLIGIKSLYRFLGKYF